MTLTPDQLATRRTGITATDISAIIGKNPWRSAIDVWLDKTGQRPPFEGNARTKWGNLLEPVLRDDYAEQYGARVEVPGTLAHKECAWKLATPDGIVYPGGGSVADRGLEIKVHGREAMMSGSLRYGDPGTDEVPAHELLQGMWGMGVTGLPRWDLRVFESGSPIDYVIDRDDELIEMLDERAWAFLVNHVRADIPPPPDGSESYDAWLKSRWSKHSDKMIEPDEQAHADLAALREAVIAAKRAERALEAAQQQIKSRIGEHSGLEWREGKGKAKVTWRFNKDGTAVDLEAMIAHLRSTAGLIASAKANELDALELHLRKLGGGYVGNLPVSGIEMLKTVQAIRGTLTEIASARVAAFERATSGARVLRVPSSWHAASKQ